MNRAGNETIVITAPSLRITEGPGKGLKILIPPAGLVIGREAGTPQLRTDAALSRRHARVEVASDGSVEVTDLESANGTFRNGQRLTEPVHLKDGDVLRLGNTELTVSMSVQEATSAPDWLADGKSLFEQGRTDESKQAFSKALSDPRSAAGAHYGLGMIWLAENDLVRAERSFLAAMEIDSSHSNAAFQLGLLAERRGEIGQARTWYHRALAAEPEHVSALARLDATAPAPNVQGGRTAMTTDHEHKDGMASSELLDRIRAKRAEVNKYVEVNARRRRFLVNLVIIAGALVVLLTAPAAIGGKSFTDWLQQLSGSSIPSWQFLCLFASLCSLASVVAIQIQKSNNYEEHIARAQGLRATLEVLEVSITSGSLTIRKATNQFLKCLEDCSFMEPIR
jgi:pSer/pThr/pTyr-binding forkhead associated (FHA) protein